MEAVALRGGVGLEEAGVGEVLRIPGGVARGQTGQESGGPGAEVGAVRESGAAEDGASGLVQLPVGQIGALLAAACMTVTAMQTPAAAQGATSGLTNWQTGYCLDSDTGGAVYTRGNSNGCGANNPYQR
ncbi:MULTISPECIES: hypothetical protein [Streptomyces]|uniref:hypothetical protein n=1 Tax=Streptomyces TaxID=1883 RepID=UPI001CCFBA58|nr:MULTISPECIES: hypothetical protein [Streptomyces]UBI40826.1 hypothetical protein K7I03_33085 [Streptomyces mobaraensis]